MSDLRVALPEPRPEDDEDVVWGLSTANALWGRGEVQDALVWLRRAAEAAEAAGQSFRASELGMYVTEIEDRLAQEGPPPRASQRPVNRSVPPPAVVVSAPPAVTRGSLDMADTLTDDTITDDGAEALPHVAAPANPPPAAAPPPAPAAPVVLQPALAAAPVAPLPPLPPRSAWTDDEQTLVRKQPVASPAVAQPAVSNPHETTLVSAKSPMRATPSAEPARPVATAPAVKTISHPAPPPAVVVQHMTPDAAPAPRPPAPPERSAPPPARPASHPPPATASQPAVTRPAEPAAVVAPLAAPAQPSAPPPASPAPSAAPAPAPAAATPHGSEPAKGAATPMTTKRRPRAPILDPWSEEPRSTAVGRSDEPRDAVASSQTEAPRGREIVAEDGTLVVSVRARPAPQPRAADDDDDVVTSAMSLDMLQKRGSGRAPPPPKSKAAGPPASVEAHPAKPPPPPPPTPSHPAQESEKKPPAVAHPATPPQPGRLATAELAPVKPTASARPPSPPPAAPPPEAAAVIPHAPPVPEVSPPPAAAAASSRPPASLPPERRAIGGCVLDRFDAFADLPQDVQVTLAESGHIEQLAADEEVSGFAAAIVLDGDALVCATIVDTPAQRVSTGTVVAARGSLAEGVALRIVAGPSGARVATWASDVLDSALRECPWVTDELRDRADRLQALAGATMGPLGDLDETYRNMAVERLTVRVVPPQDHVARAGAAIEGLMIVGVGSLELVSDGGTSTGEALPGDLVFANALLGGSAAPSDARAAEGGAILLVGDKKLAQELVVTIPPLLEILGN